MPEMDLEMVRHALQTARKNGFTTVELEVGSDVFTATLKPSAPPRPMDNEGAPEPKEDSTYIKASLVGFYQQAKNPLVEGRTVQKGDVIAVIEALRIKNDVESTVSGEVIEVLVAPGDPVEYGQPLAKVRLA